MRQGEQEAAPVIGDQSKSLLLDDNDAAGDPLHQLFEIRSWVARQQAVNARKVQRILIEEDQLHGTAAFTATPQRALGSLLFGVKSRRMRVGRSLNSHGNSTAAKCDDPALRSETAAARRRTLSDGAHARAAVSLQSGVRRLRQDRLSRRDPGSSAKSGRMYGGDRRVRRSGGVDRRRRAADPQRDARDRARL